MASAVDQSPYWISRKADGFVVVRELPKLDLESYIANYDGRTRIDRLETIGQACPHLSLEALRMAITELQKGKDVKRYVDCVEMLSEIAPQDPLAQLDRAWVEQRARHVKTERDRLEHELKGYKNNLIKESIRMGTEDLGSYLVSVGELADAGKAYARMRDYCTVSWHIAEMTLHQLYVAIEQRSWMAAQSYLAKLRSLPLMNDDKARLDPIVAACTGLAHMCNGNYKDAARDFLNVSSSLTTPPTSMVNTSGVSGSRNEYIAGLIWTRSVLTTNDIAVYGGLCALASMSRSALQKQVLENVEFRTYLELEPHLRRAITFFCNAKYGACLASLEAYRPDWLLDVYLQGRLREIFQLVRQKCIVQYFEAFSNVSFTELAKQFPPSGMDENIKPPTTTSDNAALNGHGSTGDAAAQMTPEQRIEFELITLIQAGLLPGRIDAVNHTLVSPPKNERRQVLLDALQQAEEYERTMLLKLHRINLVATGM